MSSECLNCNQPATTRYTLVLDTGEIIEEKYFCEECISDFRAEEWIKVSETPGIMRGGDAEPECDDAGESA